jgi:PAS domain S-box-containing protein
VLESRRFHVGQPTTAGKRVCGAAGILNEQLVLTVGEVAALIGLSPHTIRSWERRYDFLTPRRSASNQRRYSMEDVEILKRVKKIRGGRGGSLKLAVQEATGALVRGPIAAAPSSGVHPIAAAPDSVWRTAADLYLGPVVIIGARGHIVDCNVAFTHLSGRDREDLRGALFVDVVIPADRSRAAEFYRRPLTRRKRWELILKTAAGQPGTHLMDGEPARHEDQAVLICRATPLERPAPNR